MQEVPSYRRVGSAGAVFSLAFAGCVVGLPIAGLVLGVLLAPVGLGGVAAVMYVPAFVLWLGDLQFGRGDAARCAFDADGHHAIPLAVWLATGVAFAWAARGLGVWQQVGAAVGVIAAVTVGTHLVLAALDIRLVIFVL